MFSVICFKMGRSQIDIFAGADGDDNVSRAREQAFRMARLVLIQEKLVSYSEQFQGLYAMMRGCRSHSFLELFTSSLGR